MYSSIIKKPCKCGCGRNPSTGYAGYNYACRPDLVEEKRKDLSRRQLEALHGVNDNGENIEDDSIKNLIEDLDWVTSRITRISASDENGMCPCFTCSTVKHFTLMQSGHFISRSHMGLRFIESNQKPQCENCNCHKHGNLEVYRERLEALQSGLPDWLTEQSRQVEKPSKYELKQLLVTLRQKLKVVEAKLKK